jgi:hypothetical protein
MARERELKYDLGGEAAARRVEALLGPAPGGRLQVNRFFDTADGRLRARLRALRLRAEWEVGGDVDLPGDWAAPDRAPDRVILGLKGARAGSGAFHDRQEEERERGADFWAREALADDDLPAPWRALLPPPLLSPGEALAEWARFANLRRTYPLTGAWHAEVDRTLFGDGRRAWEVEVEICIDDDPEVARAELEALLARAGVPVVPQGKSKLERALAMD